MKNLLLLLAIILPLESQAFFWNRSEFQEADNLADLPSEAVKQRRSEKYRIVEFKLYRTILESFDATNAVEGDKANATFASMKRAPMYAYTSNDSRSILAPVPAEVYFKFADDFSAICVRRNYAGLMKVRFQTRCMPVLPGDGAE